MWKRDLALLADQHRQPRRAVAALGAAALRDARQARLMLGAAPHDLDYSGQIRLRCRPCPLPA